MLQTRLIATGKVQGVGFRSFACRIGQSLSLVGYVKNLPDNTVEILAQGEEEKIAKFCKRIQGVQLALGINVENLKAVETKEIQKPSYASFGVQ